jgi:siroheme synthase
LTLRAARALAAADILAPDLGVEPLILDLARRDAERLSPEEATPARLAALVSEGFTLVRLILQPASAAEAEALIGVDAETHSPGRP